MTGDRTGQDQSSRDGMDDNHGEGDFAAGGTTQASFWLSVHCISFQVVDASLKKQVGNWFVLPDFSCTENETAETRYVIHTWLCLAAAKIREKFRKFAVSPNIETFEAIPRRIVGRLSAKELRTNGVLERVMFPFCVLPRSEMLLTFFRRLHIRKQGFINCRFMYHECLMKLVDA